MEWSGLIPSVSTSLGTASSCNMCFEFSVAWECVEGSFPVLYLQNRTCDCDDIYLHEKWRYSFWCVCVCVCLFVFPHICGQHNFRTCWWIVMIFGIWVGVWKTKVKVNFGSPGVWPWYCNRTWISVSFDMDMLWSWFLVAHSKEEMLYVWAL